MKLLFLSFYYSPDLSAGSFRATSLAAALRERAPPATSIDVVTTLPNRYHGFTREAAETETSGNITIRRIGLPSHRSDMIGQARAYLTFARGALSYVAGKDYDVVLATSSRLMTAALGALVARKKHARLYLDIRDLFVDTIGDVLPGAFAWPVRSAFRFVERWTMRRADRINIVSRGFEDYFGARYPDRALSLFTNGIDDEFLDVVPSGTSAVKQGGSRATIVYAGNIGEGQALHSVLPGLARALHQCADFVVIGDGGRRRVLESAVAGIDNVELREPMDRAQLLDAYRSADVLFLHLGALPAFERVLPSKVFEYAALGKPVLAGVAGYAAQFIRDEIGNAAVFDPGDVSGAVRAFQSLTLREQPRPEFVEKYARANIARAMADDIYAVAKT
jgi:glycosyltransferase involved in cell wall biosynthesis